MRLFNLIAWHLWRKQKAEKARAEAVRLHYQEMQAGWPMNGVPDGGAGPQKEFLEWWRANTLGPRSLVRVQTEALRVAVNELKKQESANKKPRKRKK